ncbi:MAG: glycerophosphodiester phosphodiesterase [Gemmataceae bacterium]
MMPFALCFCAAALANEPKPAEIIAHRGASHDAPENTVAAFKLAWEQGADGAELDIHFTKDGRIVVIHDADTKRTTGTDWKVRDRTLAELRTLDAGTWKHKRFAGERLPTLDEMLATVPEGKKVFVEVKCGPEAVRELDRVLKASRLKPEQTPVISFDASVIAAVKKARPDLPAYWLVSLKNRKDEKRSVDDLVMKAREIRADGLDVSASDVVDAAFAAKVKAAGLRLDVWTVDDPAVARRVAPFVAGITTNRPAWLREQLKK